MSTLDLDEVKKRLAKAEKWAKKDDDDSPAEEQFRRELYEWLKRLALDYLTASAERRLAIRTLFERTPVLAQYLPSIGEVLSRDVKSPADAATIRAALAMVSMNDLQSDSRDAQVSLVEILRSARTAKIDPRPLLEEAGAASSITTREFLEQFR